MQTSVTSNLNGFVESQHSHDLCSTEHDAAYSRDGKNEFVTVKALNEWGAGSRPNAMDWRSKLDSQRGAVIATELKNNATKVARWATQALLAGSDLLKIGYVDCTSW